jgi:hypothetical protein
MKTVFAVALTLLMVAAGPILATPFEIQDLEAAFVDAAPPGTTNLDIDNSGNPITIRWGNTTALGMNQQSGYDFESLVDPMAPISGAVPPTTAWLPLGEFTHHNFHITGTFLSSVGLDLTLTLQLGEPGEEEVFTPTFSFLLDHNETPNNLPCCDDIVTVSSPLLGNVFTVGLTQFTLQLGFSQDGGATISDQFITVENQANMAGLFGQLSATVIPEPGTWTLIGLGLAGVAIGSWRRRRVR